MATKNYYFDSFGLTLHKIRFICNIDTVQSNLTKWGDNQILTLVLPKFYEKVWEKREKWYDEERVLSFVSRIGKGQTEQP